MIIHLIETISKYLRRYIGVDMANKRVVLLVGHTAMKAQEFILKPDSDLFQIIPQGWQSYCRIAWRNMKK